MEERLPVARPWSLTQLARLTVLSVGSLPRMVPCLNPACLSMGQGLPFPLGSAKAHLDFMSTNK